MRRVPPALTDRQRAQQGMLILTLFLAMVSTVAWALWTPAPPDGTTVPQPAPHHWEYREYPAGGLMLSDPLVIPDSLGHIPTILIPPGSILVVPKWVEGEEPEQRRDQS